MRPLALPSPGRGQGEGSLIVFAMTRSPSIDRRAFLAVRGPSRSAYDQRAGFYIDRILEGASPRDLPMEQPAKDELVVNGQTARARGLPLPQSLLGRADRVIESTHLS
jgi:hypothetical protein